MLISLYKYIIEACKMIYIFKKIWNKSKTSKRLRNILSYIYDINNSKKIRGKNNIIIYKGAFLKNSKIIVNGNNNKILIHKNTRLMHCLFYIKGCNHIIQIGENCVLYNTNFWAESNDSIIDIGDNTTSQGGEFSAAEDSKIKVGQDCMFSYNFGVHTGDAHSIISIETGNRINLSKNIIIKNHVWICSHAQILKGVEIGNNSVIGLGSIVTKNISDNSVTVGNPARIIRTNVNWNRKLSGIN